MLRSSASTVVLTLALSAQAATCSLVYGICFIVGVPLGAMSLDGVSGRSCLAPEDISLSTNKFDMPWVHA